MDAKNITRIKCTRWNASESEWGQSLSTPIEMDKE